jgi:hypothetical protein
MTIFATYSENPPSFEGGFSDALAQLNALSPEGFSISLTF